MKAALNGGLNLSILDGWWDEMYDGENGWAIPSADGVDDLDRRDELEAAALYDLLENAGRAALLRPRRRRRAAALARDGPAHAADRSARRCWPPGWSATTSTSCTSRPPGRRRALADVVVRGGQGARRLEGEGRVAWPGVRVEHVEASGVGDTPELGAALELRAHVDLGGLGPADVDGRRPRTGGSTRATGCRPPAYLALAYAGDGDDGLHRCEGTVPLERPGAFGYTVRVLPHATRCRATPTWPADDGLAGPGGAAERRRPHR